jgi:hypothetical protein
VCSSDLETIKKELKDLAYQVEKLNRSLEQLVPLGDATGLSLSIPTLMNLQRLVRGEQDFEKINPAGCDVPVFRELLGVNMQMALRFRHFFFDPNPDKKIEEIEVVSDELIQKAKKHFIM